MPRAVFLKASSTETSVIEASAIGKANPEPAKRDVNLLVSLTVGPIDGSLRQTSKVSLTTWIRNG